MEVLRWLVVACAFLVAAWFVFDGVRALVVGDYVTPKSGERAGQLGPWSRVVAKVGIEPRSTTMKLIFLLLGICGLVTVVCFLLQLPWAWWAMLVMAILWLWYVPVGSFLGALELILLIVIHVRS